MWIQGKSVSTGLPAPVSVTLIVQPGDTLIVSIGCAASQIYGLLFNLELGDNRSNIYTLAAVSPVQGGEGISGGSQPTTQIATFIAYNCPAGSTTVTMSGPGASGLAMLVDEYSGVVAINGVTFNSTVAGIGASSVDSGNLIVTGSKVAYSVAFGDSQGLTWTPSSGFTQRQNQNGANGVSLASFDQALVGGVADNNVSASAAPASSVHVVVLLLSQTPVSSTVLQTGWGVLSGIAGQIINVPFPYPTKAGTLLILLARVYERSDFTVIDSQSNLWTVISEPVESPNWVMAYAISAGGPCTVTLNGTAGGDDVSYIVNIAEYNVKQATFVAESSGSSLPGASVNTGNVAAGSGSTLLVAGLVAIPHGDTWVNFPPVGTSPLRWRYQLSDSGFVNEALSAIALSDQIVNTAGNYSNTFTPTTSSDDLYAIILGFTINTGNPVNGLGLVTPCGKLPTLEVTRDVDDDWTDESTLYITQDEPLPFTLRALVIRDNYNTD